MRVMRKCLAFDHAVSINPNGMTQPCCVYYADKPIHYTENWHEEFVELGKKPLFINGCRDCEWEEKQGEPSHMANMNKKLAGHRGVVYWDLKFNNTCNLACRMCKPQDSSTWEQIVTDEYDDQFYNVWKTGWHKDIDKILEQMPSARYLKFTGGEPFLIPQMWQILDYCVANGYAKDIEVEVTTNGTMLKKLDVFKKFKRVEFLVSADAVGERYEYIRPGAKWNTVANNIIELNKDFDVAVSALPMIFNKDNMEDLNEWGRLNNIEVRWSPPLEEPTHLRVDALEICPDKFYKYAKLMDKQHNTNYKDFI